MKDKNYFLKKAQENFPELYYRELTPDITEFTATSGDSIVLDLGEHAVGHFSFSFDNIDRFVDAPVRFVHLSQIFLHIIHLNLKALYHSHSQ